MKIDHGSSGLHVGHDIAYKEGYNQAIDDVKARLVADIGGK